MLTANVWEQGKTLWALLDNVDHLHQTETIQKPYKTKKTKAFWNPWNSSSQAKTQLTCLVLSHLSLEAKRSSWLILWQRLLSFLSQRKSISKKKQHLSWVILSLLNITFMPRIMVVSHDVFLFFLAGWKIQESWHFNELLCGQQADVAHGWGHCKMAMKQTWDLRPPLGLLLCEMAAEHPPTRPLFEWLSTNILSPLITSHLLLFASTRTDWPLCLATDSCRKVCSTWICLRSLEKNRNHWKAKPSTVS